MVTSLYLGCTRCTDEICLALLWHSDHFWVMLCCWDSQTLTLYQTMFIHQKFLPFSRLTIFKKNSTFMPPMSFTVNDTLFLRLKLSDFYTLSQTTYPSQWQIPR